MAVIEVAAGPWSQIASLFFLLGGSFADLLIVRLMLTCAYVFLLAHVLAGFAAWPLVYQEPDEPFVVAIDSIVWGLLGAYVHGSSLFRLLYEERFVLLTPEEEEMWRMFYRRARISRLLFKEQILPKSEFRTYEAGALIVDPAMPQRLHVIVQGRAHGVVKLKDGESFDIRMVRHSHSPNLRPCTPAPPRFTAPNLPNLSHASLLAPPLPQVSGDLFEYKHLHLFGVPVGFIDRDMTVHARSRVRTFSIGVDRLEQMASGSAAMRQAWLTVIIAGLARQAELNYYRGERNSEGRAAAKLDDWIDPAFSELLPEELPPPHTPGSGFCLWPWPIKNLAAIMRRTFSPPWPFHQSGSGVRHTAVNTHQDVALIGETHRFLRSGASRSQSHHGAPIDLQRSASKEMAAAAGPSIVAIV
jgi:CRP-like cAMP-binding protein